MATSRDEILRKALSLPEQDRADLIGALIESLDVDVEEGVEEAWRAEIERRGKELDFRRRTEHSLGSGEGTPVARSAWLATQFDCIRSLADEAEGARAWYLARNPTIADAFLLELHAAVASIGEGPGGGRESTDVFGGICYINSHSASSISNGPISSRSLPWHTIAGSPGTGLSDEVRAL